MAQWGNTDDAANSVLWATTAVNLTPNTDNQTALFSNTTASAFLNNGVAMQKTVGQFGLDATKLQYPTHRSLHMKQHLQVQATRLTLQ